jgi:hypothetical protein
MTASRAQPSLGGLLHPLASLAFQIVSKFAT